MLLIKRLLPSLHQVVTCPGVQELNLLVELVAMLQLRIAIRAPTVNVKHHCYHKVNSPTRDDGERLIMLNRDVFICLMVCNKKIIN